MYFGDKSNQNFQSDLHTNQALTPIADILCNYPSLAQADSERPFTPALQFLPKISSPALQKTAGFWAGLGS